MKLLKETTELEMEAWKNNYKKQQSLQLAEREAVIREQCRKERDREIETVIERLEMEATENRLQLEQTTENRIRCVFELVVVHEALALFCFRRLKEKFDHELLDLERSEHEAKNKYLEVKNRLLEAEEQVMVLRANVKQLQQQLDENKEVR